MENLHIMHNEKFTYSYIEFINKNFSKKNNKYLIIDGNEKIKLPNFENVVVINCLKNINQFLKKIKIILIFTKIFRLPYLSLKKEMDRSKKIYFHSLFDKRIILFLFIFRKYLKKSNWIIWGGDLYCYENRKKRLIDKIWYFIEDYVKGNIEYINVLVPKDYEIAKKYYKVKGKYKRAFYPIKVDFNFLDSLIPIKKQEIYIQVGNSATESNNHFEILDDLAKFKNERIKIFCILSYGDKEYGKKVEYYGKKIFGNKFIGIFDFMPLEEYYKYLINIDILIFNQKRQQGLANLEVLSYFEKKIYLRDDISSWEYLTEDLSLKINSYKEIKKQTFEEFIENNAKGNKEKIKKTVYSDEYRIKIWQENFNN